MNEKRRTIGGGQAQLSLAEVRFFSVILVLVSLSNFPFAICWPLSAEGFNPNTQRRRLIVDTRLLSGNVKETLVYKTCRLSACIVDVCLPVPFSADF